LNKKVTKMRIVFWGTSEFALPSLDALLKESFSTSSKTNFLYRVVAVVTNPDEPAGRKQILTPPPVKVLAKKHKIPVYQPENLKLENWQQELPEADLYIVAAYGKIIPKDILDKPSYGALNIHPSLLPRWRGPSPIQYTILNGDSETGVTIIKMDEMMDHGPIVAQQRLTISQPVYKELKEQLAKLGAKLLLETLPKWLKGEITPTPQDDSQATYSKILKKDDGRINWQKSAEEIERLIRAFNPWPGTWTMLPTKKKILRLIIEEAEIVKVENPLAPPGYLFYSDNYPLLIKTGYGSLLIKKLTLEGRKKMSGEDFRRGYQALYNTTLI